MKNLENLSNALLHLQLKKQWLDALKILKQRRITNIKLFFQRIALEYLVVSFH